MEKINEKKKRKKEKIHAKFLREMYSRINWQRDEISSKVGAPFLAKMEIHFQNVSRSRYLNNWQRDRKELTGSVTVKK